MFPGVVGNKCFLITMLVFFLWGELFDVQQAGEDSSQSFASQGSTSQIRLARWIGLSNRKIFDSAAQDIF
jgi:hypothetical protein